VSATALALVLTRRLAHRTGVPELPGREE
jgi:hypothetical protein